MHTTHTATRASLILRLQNMDDVAAWDEFAAIYGPVIYRVAKSRGFQPADAENLVQEVFLAVSKAVSQWLAREDRGRFRPWLLRITRNEAADMLTERASRPLGRDGSAGERILGQLAGRDELSGALDWEYERAVFRWAVEQVRDSVAAQTWDAFWLTSVECVSVSEAASRLKTRPGNIYFARSRVMSRIKHMVEQYGEQA